MKVIDLLPVLDSGFEESDSVGIWKLFNSEIEKIGYVNQREVVSLHGSVDDLLNRTVERLSVYQGESIIRVWVESED